MYQVSSLGNYKIICVMHFRLFPQCWHCPSETLTFIYSHAEDEAQRCADSPIWQSTNSTNASSCIIINTVLLLAVTCCLQTMDIGSPHKSQGHLHTASASHASSSQLKVSVCSYCLLPQRDPVVCTSMNLFLLNVSSANSPL